MEAEPRTDPHLQRFSQACLSNKDVWVRRNALSNDKFFEEKTPLKAMEWGYPFWRRPPLGTRPHSEQPLPQTPSTQPSFRKTMLRITTQGTSVGDYRTKGNPL